MKRGKMDKGGISHVDVIVSLVVFLGFIIFLLIFLTPLTKTEISSVILDICEDGIESYANVNYSYITIKTNAQTDKNCFSIPLKMKNVIAKDEWGNKLNAGSSGDKVYFAKSGDFYIIYSSPVFNEESVLTNCLNLNENEFKFGFLRENNVLGNKSLNELKQEYLQDYSRLKDGFKIPASNDFAFSIRDTEGNEIVSAIKKQSSKINVIARDIPLQLLYENGTIEYVILNIRAW